MAHLGDRVAAFVDGQLSDDEHEAALEHLRRCADCRDAVGQQELLKHRMTGLHATLAPSASLLSTLADPNRLPRRPERSLVARIWHLPGLRTLVALTGASLTVTAVAYAVGTPATDDEETTNPPVDQFVASFMAASATSLRPARSSSRPTGGSVYRLASADRSGAARMDSAEAVDLLRKAAGSNQSVSLALLKKNFDLSVASTAPIDGREATEVIAARDGHVSASYWIAQDNGALLRTVAYDRSGTPVSQSDAAPSDRASSTSEASAVASQIPQSSLSSLQKSGWPCHDTLARDMERVNSQWLDDHGEQIVTLNYSDGVSTLTLFEQNGALDVRSLDDFEVADIRHTRVWVRSGNPTVATWDDRGVVYTIVTDADRSRLTDAIDELPRDTSGRGPTMRIGKGIQRISAWVDPMR